MQNKIILIAILFKNLVLTKKLKKKLKHKIK